MDMLEVIFFSNILSNKRLDPQFFNKKYTNFERRKILQKTEIVELGGLCAFIFTGPSGNQLPKSSYSNKGIKILRPSNLRGYDIEYEECPKISNEAVEIKKYIKYRKNDVLVSRVGDFKTGIINKKDESFVISPNIIAIRTGERLNPYFLIAFFNSKFCKEQINRVKKQTSLGSVTKREIESLLLPIIDINEQKKIAIIVVKSIERQRLAKKYFDRANKIISKCVEETRGNRACRIIPFVDIRSKNRADPQFLLDTNYEKNEIIKCKKLSELAILKKGIEVGSNNYKKTGKLFLRTCNISNFGYIEKSQKYISQSLFGKLADEYKPGLSEVIFVKDGTPGVSCMLYERELESILSSGLVRIILFDKISPEYLMASLNSDYCKAQYARQIDGSLIKHLKFENLGEIKIPLLDEKKQTEITFIINKAFCFYKDSMLGLNRAQEMVSNLIGELEIRRSAGI